MQTKQKRNKRFIPNAVQATLLLLAAFGAVFITQQPPSAAARTFAPAFAPAGAPYQQINQLIAADGAINDFFGNAVAVDDDVLVIGAPGDDGPGGVNQGAAYVYLRVGAGYEFHQKLTLSGGNLTNHQFGIAVAVNDDTIVVGVDGATSQRGAAVIFTRVGEFWSAQSPMLLADDGQPSDYFGRSVAIADGLIFVGAPGDDTGGNNEQGAVYPFKRVGGNWIQQPKLLASDGLSSDAFGSALALSYNSILGTGTLVVSAPYDDLNGGAGQGHGGAYVFTTNGGAWSQQQKLTADDAAAHDNFGFSIALGGDTLVVGAVSADIAGQSGQGAAYVFTRNGSSWNQQQKLTAVGGSAGDGFGNAVAIYSQTILIGSYTDDLPPLTSTNGSAYLFTRSGAVWSQQQKLSPSPVQSNSYFGNAVTLTGQTAIIGAPGQDGKGAAFIFAPPPNASPTIGTLSVIRNAGTAGVVSSIANVGDAEDAENDLQVTVNGSANATVNGVTVNGISVSGSGIVSATVTAACNATTASFTLRVTDSAAAFAQATLTVTVNPNTPPVLSYASPQSMNAGDTLNLAPTLGPSDNGVVASISIQGIAPAMGGAVTVNAAGVVTISNPTISGSHLVTLRATDNCGAFTDVNLTINVSGGCPTITLAPGLLPASTVGAAYAHTITASGGSAPYTFGLSAGVLPGGLTLMPNGNLTGTLTQAGDFNFTVKATAANGCTGTRAYNVHINGVIQPVAGLQFYPLAHPVRLLDTRPGQVGCDAPNAPVAGGTSRIQTAAGRACGGLTIPANAKALTGNITTVESGGGYLTLYPSDAAQPLVASSNYAPNEILNNVFTVGLGAGDGAFKIFAVNNTHVVVDVTGYYAPPSAQGLYFHPLPKPVRLLDTRPGAQGCFTPSAPLPQGSNTPQLGQTTCDSVQIPAGARALVGNATTVNPQNFGYLTLYPADAAQPLVASSNFTVGQVMNAPFTVGLAPGGFFNIFTTTTTDLVVDVLGYYSADANDVNGAGLLFNPLPAPVRLLETRAGFTGCYTPGVPLAAATPYTQAATGACVNIPAAARGIVGNATVVNGQAGYLTFWPSNAAQPLVANSNYLPGQVLNRHFTVGLGADGAFKLFASGQTDLVIDVTGYFVP